MTQQVLSIIFGAGYLVLWGVTFFFGFIPTLLLTGDVIALSLTFRPHYPFQHGGHYLLAKLEQRLKHPTNETEWTEKEAITWLNAFVGEVNELLRLTRSFVFRKEYTSL